LNDERERLVGYLAILGLEAPPTIPDQLLRYAAELVRWSRRVDLTGARDLAGFVAGPLADALTLVPSLPATGRLVDVGSGGGLPGIPAKILVPGLEVTLVEPRARRCAFLRHVTALLGLEVTIVEGRDEVLPDAGFDLAVAEAVWSPEEWLPRGRRLVRPGGTVFVLAAAPPPAGTPFACRAHLLRAGQTRYVWSVD